MTCDPCDPRSATDFDADNPVELEGFPGHTVRVFREPGRRCGDAPHLVLEFDGERHPLRHARGYDTRDTIPDAALPLARILAAPDVP